MRSLNHLRFRFIRIFSFLLALLEMGSLGSCGSDQTSGGEMEIFVVVNVTGLTSEITSLRVESVLSGTAAQSAQDVTGRLDRFALALPLSKTGHLKLNVLGRSSEQCNVARGVVEIDIHPPPPTRYEVSVALAQTGENKTCSLSVQVLGKGTVTSNPTGISCTGTGGGKAATCSYDFPVGATIRLDSSSDPKVYGVAYSGLCKGSGSCSLTLNKGGTVKVGFAGRVCSVDNWCFWNPLPQGNQLRGIWGAAPDDIWAVGDGGTILHYDGATWSAPVPIGAATKNDLYTIYGTSAKDIWAAGANGTLIHYDGQNWSSAPDSGARTDQALYGIWGSGPNDYWAVGEPSKGALIVLHYDGKGWSVGAVMGILPATTLYSVWGSGPTDIWAVGAQGFIIHYGGTSWADASGSPRVTNNDLRTISGTARDRIYALGLGGVALKYDGNSWTEAPMSGTIGMYRANGTWVGANTVWVVGDNGSYTAGATAHLEGSTWQTPDPMTGGELNALWATSDTDVWAVANYGQIVHWDGQTWSPAPLSTPYSTEYYTGVWGNGPSDVWTVSSAGTVRHFDGTSWSAPNQVSSQTLNVVWGTMPNNVIVADQVGGIYRYDGTSWSSAASCTGTACVSTPYAMYGTTATEIWIVGSSLALLKYNSTTHAAIAYTPPAGPPSNTLFGVWGADSYNIFAIGNWGVVLKYNGSAWSDVTPTSPPLSSATYRGMWGSYDSINRVARIWSLGYPLSFATSDGVAWRPDAQAGPFPSNLVPYSIFGTTANNIWASASNFTVLYYDGTKWTTRNSGTQSPLYGIWTASTVDAWAVGHYQAILRYQP